MGLAVVARYSVLGEAHAARGALESAGLFVVVMDDGLGNLNFLWQQIIQGFRLCVPADDLESARAILTEALREGAQAEPSDIRPRNPADMGWVVAVVASFFLLPPFALGLEATRRRPTPARIAMLIFMALFWGLCWSPLVFREPSSSAYYGR